MHCTYTSSASNALAVDMSRVGCFLREAAGVGDGALVGRRGLPARPGLAGLESLSPPLSVAVESEEAESGLPARCAFRAAQAAAEVGWDGELVALSLGPADLPPAPRMVISAAARPALSGNCVKRPLRPAMPAAPAVELLRRVGRWGECATRLPLGGDLPFTPHPRARLSAGVEGSAATLAPGGPSSSRSARWEAECARCSASQAAACCALLPAPRSTRLGTKMEARMPTRGAARSGGESGDRSLPGSPPLRDAADLLVRKRETDLPSSDRWRVRPPSPPWGASTGVAATPVSACPASGMDTGTSRPRPRPALAARRVAWADAGRSDLRGGGGASA